jgi:hypothetical protein
LIRLYILVEGQTEEEFVKHTLQPHLLHHGVDARVIVVATRRDRAGRKHRGGGRWSHWKRDLEVIARQQHASDVRITTLFDLYGLPKDFPQPTDLPRTTDTRVVAECLEEVMAEAIGDSQDRLIPYLERHEFEALVLAALDHLEAVIDRPDQLRGLAALRREIGDQSPEDIDDSPLTAPSKRLHRLVPGYQKTLHGTTAVNAAGISRLREACPRFSQWVGRLESLGGTLGVDPGR